MVLSLPAGKGQNFLFNEVELRNVYVLGWGGEKSYLPL